MTDDAAATPASHLVYDEIVIRFWDSNTEVFVRTGKRWNHGIFPSSGPKVLEKTLADLTSGAYRLWPLEDPY